MTATLPEPIRMVPLEDVRGILTAAMTGEGRSYLEDPVTGYGGKYLTLDKLLSGIAGLPDPCPEERCIASVMAVFEEHGCWHLVDDIQETWLRKWPEPTGRGDESPKDQDNRPRCALCGALIPESRLPLARFCCDQHRKNAHGQAKTRERRQRLARLGKPPEQAPAQVRTRERKPLAGQPGGCCRAPVTHPPRYLPRTVQVAE
jgi:hypothetical protein